MPTEEKPCNASESREGHRENTSERIKKDRVVICMCEIQAWNAWKLNNAENELRDRSATNSLAALGIR